MKAIAYNAFGPAEVLREMSLTVPEPGDDEVLIRVCATSVNPLDWKIRSRQLKLPLKGGFPRVPGSDVSGVVERVGVDVTSVQPGDEVYALLDYRRDGAAAEFVRSRATFLYKKPPSLSYDEAACVPLAALTALQALKLKARMQKGERVLITGASGGVGHFAVQLAKNYGAHVTATASAKNADFARGLGADEVIAYDTGGVPEGPAFDVIFDPVRAYDYSAAVTRLLPAGRYVSTSPDLGGMLRTKLLKWVGDKRQCLFLAVVPDPHGLKYLHEQIEAGALKPHLQQIFPLERLADAHRISEDGHVVGKLAVHVA
ncbi:MAG: NAD(P)-dependent alcohol dehydrogenase [Nitrospirota bacterium]|nr:NAD(P)-dependent alcohol dehydrogenase [Nitrospirota bacterium]